MVSNGGNLPDQAKMRADSRGLTKGDYVRIFSTVLVVVALGLVMVLVGSANPHAIEMLSNHHTRSKIEHVRNSHDDDRLEELTRLASAAQSEAKQAAALKSTEAHKLRITPESKVDAELMLAREAAKKSKTLKGEISSIHSKVRVMRKKIRRDNHAAREEDRLLHKVQGGLRDSMLALHDKEMKVLEARHDVQNAAKDGDVAALREAQKRLANRKAIAKGARAEYDEQKKRRDQVAARDRLLRARAKDDVEATEQMRATAHNDKLHAREEAAAARAIRARANYIRDQAALDSAQSKYSTLAQLLADPSSDHTQVEETLSKIASNIHSWKELKGQDEKALAAKVSLYKRARTRLSSKAIALADAAAAAADRVGDAGGGAEKAYRAAGLPTLLETAAGPGPASWAVAPPAAAAVTTELRQQAPQYAYAPAQAAAAPPQQPYYPPAQAAQAPAGWAAPAYGGYPQQQPPALQSAAALPAGQTYYPPPQQQYAAPPQQAPAPASAATPPHPAVLPGAVGNIPYVYNDRQFLPSPLQAGAGFPIVWLFADNKTPDPLYFGFQSSDGVMHVYNEIKPHGVTRQQAFGNEYWTILASDKRTVAVQPFKVTQNNQWLSIAPAPAR